MVERVKGELCVRPASSRCKGRAPPTASWGIALATLAQVDVLVSWNFRHIVRLDKIQRFNAVNLESGYQPLAIYSPREVTSYDTEPDSGR